MPKGKKRLTQREKAERAAIKKQLQADGVLPPDKPRLNRKKFAREVWDEFSEMDVYTADFYLRKAIMATVGPELHEVTSEQVGILFQSTRPMRGATAKVYKITLHTFATKGNS